jgi:hypothetical protein
VAAHHADPAVARALIRRWPALAQGKPPQPHPEALSWVLTLVGGSLVLGPVPGEDDPALVRWLGVNSGRLRNRRITDLGLAKVACAGIPDEPSPEWLAAAEGDRYRELLADHRLQALARDPRLIRQAVVDVRTPGPDDSRARLAGLGLLSLGRLLHAVDPRRARWLLQHFPYRLARKLHSLGRLSAVRLPGEVVLGWEERLLEVAIDLGTQANPGPEEDDDAPGLQSAEDGP